MPLFEVVLKISHDCPYGNISRKFPSVKMCVWCNREHEVIELIVDKREHYSAVMEEISKVSDIIEKTSDQDKVHLIVKTCSCFRQKSVTKYIDALNLLEVSPVTYNQGWEYYRLIAFSHRELEELLWQLKKQGFTYEIVRKVPFNGFIASSLTLTADALFSNLTDKQMDALLTAYSHGYYRLPRCADIQTIADKRRMPRTTFQEHLKKAENKLIASLVPYIQLFKNASPEKRESLKITNKF